jgi:hypothetical protein
MAYVSATLLGGFANRLFIIHAALNYAHQTNRKFVLIDKLIQDVHHESKSIILQNLEKLFGKFIYYTVPDYVSWKIINDNKQCAFNYSEIPKYEGKSVIFEGYFQNPQYIPKMPDLKTELIRKPNTYFLHIRLGDYLKIPLYNIPLKKYYSESIMQIMESDNNAKFLVFSNDNVNAKTFIETNIKVPFSYTFSEALSGYDTLLEMASCAGGICANSTLSWMGAYYQKSPRILVFMPSPWLSKGYVDIYPEWATIIDSMP